MKIKNLLIGATLSIGLLGGCSGGMTVSAEKIVSNVLEADKKVDAYYGKSEMKVYKGKEVTEHIMMEEFVSNDQKRKVITTDLKKDNQKTVALNDGKKVIIYELGSDKAMSMTFSDEEVPVSMSPKEQFTKMLEGMGKTHTYKVVGEEKILGLNTYHLKLKAKSKNSVLGDMEFWVDQKTWFIVKSITNSGENRTETEYKKLDFSPKFAKDTFILKLPKNVKVENLDNNLKPMTGTVAEAEKALGEPFLIFDEKAAKLEMVEWLNLKGELNRTEVTIYYKTPEGSAFTLSIFPTPKEKGMKIEGEDSKIRGQHAGYMEEIRAVTWDENGMRYTIMAEQPDLSLEKMSKLAESMHLSTNK
ncbi:DUF2092 domain-containing protein [Bacillus sp. RG28]|uniref:DUF2092 domain-containing protein n=1 Tax=Gottfriedia endophytica TaxID=2820819 RepID=A0A940NS66_9BACI|nr:DUF2092 domain-containing protein [Gottfriedia endophytica]MBP0727304.1 DUF2092 domain-containing protein [Gottfriedia endophytica]